MKKAPFCIYNGSVDLHDDCCTTSQRAATVAPGVDLDTYELAEVALDEFSGDVDAAAEHLVNLRAWLNR